MPAPLDFAARSNVPSQGDQKSKADRAIQDRNRPHAQEAPPTPTPPAVTRNRRAVPEPIATLPNLRGDVLCRRAATRKENDKNREPRPAEFPRAIDQSSTDESAPTGGDRTILARGHWDEICRATQNLLLRVQAARRQFPTVAKPVYLRAL